MTIVAFLQNQWFHDPDWAPRFQGIRARLLEACGLVPEAPA